nr:cell envelope integrity EipB family protein [Pararhizobium haloflavum]
MLPALGMLGAIESPAAAASASALVPHRAVYDLKLEETQERSGISGMYGRMVYEMKGSPCDGFSVSFRFVTRVDTEEFSRVTDQQTTTYENLEEETFRFVTRSFVDDSLDDETSGSARRGDGGGIDVTLNEPEERSLSLNAGKFPTEHMLELITRAEEGDRFYQSHIYDGSEDGDRVMLTTTVVGDREEPSTGDTELSEAGDLEDAAYWPVSMAYFNEQDRGDETPDYQISFKLHDNGVTRDLVMDYGDFVLSGKLQSLELFERADCTE